MTLNSDGDFSICKIHVRLAPGGNLSVIQAWDVEMCGREQTRVGDLPFTFETMRPQEEEGKTNENFVLSPPPGIIGSSAWAELNRMIGLKQVKKQIALLVSSAYAQKKYNLTKPKNSGLHMVFSGNPGCGKTTVAPLWLPFFKTSRSYPATTSLKRIDPA